MIEIEFYFVGRAEVIFCSLFFVVLEESDELGLAGCSPHGNMGEAPLREKKEIALENLLDMCNVR